MKEQLTDEQRTAINNFRTKSGEALRAGNIDESISFSLQAWEVLPDMKVNYAESYHIADGIIFIYMQAKDYENAEKWAEMLYDCAKDRIDDGEREYISGKIAFEKGNKEEAMKFFKIANEKSRGRCWDFNEKKYKVFFKAGK